MFVLCAIVAIVLAGAALASAAGKLTRSAQVMQMMSGVGVSATQVPVLAGLEIAGAVGLLIGLGVVWLGVAAGVGLAICFLLVVSILAVVFRDASS